MKSYSSYKNSGMEWIGKIPNDWNRTFIKNLVDIKITDGPHLTPKWIDNGIPFLSVESIQNSKIDFSKRRGDILLEDHIEYSKKCKPILNDILLVKSGSVGKLCIVETEIEFNVWSPLCLIRINKKGLPKYYYYFFHTKYFQILLKLNCGINTQPNIGMGVIENLKVIIPPKETQSQIVSFLDTKTQKIDELIEKTEKKIELLKEKRTSLINHCVTKGLNPNVEMKDSGVEWIGEIPSGWDLIRLKYLFSLEGGKGPKNIQEDDGQYPILGTGGEIDRGSDFLYDKPTLLLGRKGTIDKPFLFEEPFWVSDVMYYTIQKKDVTPKYLFLLFKLIPFEYFKYGSTQPSMSRLDYESMLFPIPPLKERSLITEYLDEQTQKIDTTIEKETQRIGLLKEYRQSLISEVVTGKIDVRDYNEKVMK
ncbi:MAG: restriction endonuclease subunit S [Candidatus Marinimicrobia bacterium]|nr:restriction endonuclease subunit S [Candidatus Neomarinimicrobiota bacterium]